MRSKAEVATSAWVFVGNEVKYIFRSAFSFLSKVLWLKELWARVYFSSGTVGLSGRHYRNNRSSEGEVRMWCSKWKWEYGLFDVWAMTAATAYWVDRVSLSGTCSFLGSSKSAVKSNRERISGRKQEWKLVPNLVEGLHYIVELGVLLLLGLVAHWLE